MKRMFFYGTPCSDMGLIITFLNEAEGNVCYFKLLLYRYP